MTPLTLTVLQSSGPDCVMCDDELSSIPNLISPSTVLNPSEQSGPLSLTLTSDASEVTTVGLQDPHLDYDEQLELTQVRREYPLVGCEFNMQIISRKN